jgi:hypothetical protein
MAAINAKVSCVNNRLHNTVSAQGGLSLQFGIDIPVFALADQALFAV